MWARRAHLNLLLTAQKGVEAYGADTLAAGVLMVQLSGIDSLHLRCQEISLRIAWSELLKPRQCGVSPLAVALSSG